VTGFVCVFSREVARNVITEHFQKLAVHFGSNRCRFSSMLPQQHENSSFRFHEMSPLRDHVTNHVTGNEIQVRSSRKLKMWSESWLYGMMLRMGTFVHSPEMVKSKKSVENVSVGTTTDCLTSGVTVFLQPNTAVPMMTVTMATKARMKTIILRIVGMTI
jgi:hypothetical protein